MESKEHRRLLTVDEVVEHLRLGRTSVNSYLWSGMLPSIRLGRRRLIDPDDLQEFIRKHKYAPDHD